MASGPPHWSAMHRGGKPAQSERTLGLRTDPSRLLAEYQGAAIRVMQIVNVLCADCTSFVSHELRFLRINAALAGVG